ncbi:unnamed protein product [Linum tenue]|nr:unnamed protein product [Linum tenue]
MLAILDDTYDNFATYEEAHALTEAIERMDVRALQELPDRMRNVYSVILNLYDEIEKETGKIGPTFGVQYAKAEFEQKRNHVASAVECCMKEYRVSEKEAVEFLWKEISNAWKDIVEEYCQKPTLLPSTDLTDRLLNLTRLINIFYDDGDCLINSHLLKDHLTSLFIDPVPL